MSAADRALREEVLRLREEVLRLRGILAGRECRARLAAAPVRLSPSEAIILGALMAARAPLARERLHLALYSGRVDGGPASDVLPVLIVRLRRKLATLGVEIRNIYGWGYELPPASAAWLNRRADECDGDRDDGDRDDGDSGDGERAWNDGRREALA